MGDPVLHIQLRDWADAFLIAPLDANTLAKLANGLCDNLLVTDCILPYSHLALSIFNRFASRHPRRLRTDMCCKSLGSGTKERQNGCVPRNEHAHVAASPHCHSFDDAAVSRDQRH